MTATYAQAVTAQTTIALAGNPNCGKTTLFNALTGARQHVGNYPGVTVEKKTGSYTLEGHKLHLVDLPGTYSLTAYSLEEVVARDFVIHEKPAVIIAIVDASNLERNLYLTAQLLEMGVPIVYCLNKYTIKSINSKVSMQARYVPSLMSPSGNGRKSLAFRRRRQFNR